jgi:ribosomal-protein-alanine N-acetyltransferase
MAGLTLVPMTMDDVDEVHALECSVFPIRGAAPTSAIRCSRLRRLAAARRRGELAGYFLLMYALDEAHLLDVAVAGERQGTGLGRHLLDRMCVRARSDGRGIGAARSAPVERARAGRV